MEIINATIPAINAPYVHKKVSTLGGIERASLIVKVSKDGMANWVNGIFENSRFAMFSIDSDGTMELFAKQYTMLKFRKCKVKSVSDAIAKINQYLNAN